MIDNTTGAILIKLSSILNNISEVEDVAERIHFESKSWFVKMREAAFREKLEKESKEYRSHY